MLAECLASCKLQSAATRLCHMFEKGECASRWKKYVPNTCLTSQIFFCVCCLPALSHIWRTNSAWHIFQKLKLQKIFKRTILIFLGAGIVFFFDVTFSFNYSNGKLIPKNSKFCLVFSFTFLTIEMLVTFCYYKKYLIAALQSSHIFCNL